MVWGILILLKDSKYISDRRLLFWTITYFSLEPKKELGDVRVEIDQNGLVFGASYWQKSHRRDGDQVFEPDIINNFVVILTIDIA